MKKMFQVLGVLSIMVFSFYYTDRIALLVQQKNPVLQEIENNKKDLEVSSVDATIMDNYIIPGINGSRVNVKESFYNMKSLNTYNEAYLIYDSISPKISLKDNKDKIIISGNKNKKQISIIIENDYKLKQYFNNYRVDLLVNKNNYDSTLKYELINNEKNSKLFDQVNSLLNVDNKNKYICLYNEYNKDICKKNGNYLIKNNLKLANNIVEVKSKVDNGSIILITKNTKLNDIKVLLSQIKFKDLEIVYLSQLIKE